MKGIALCLGLGLVFWVISFAGNTAPRSPFWLSELVLYAGMIGGLLALRRHDYRLVLPLRRALACYIALVWLFGMAYETSLTVDGTGIGGVHPDTFASFVLATGDYLMLAVLCAALIHTLRLDFRQVFFLAAGISLSEGLVFTGVLTAVLASPMAYTAPLFVAYYALAYASFIALPLLVILPASLWRPKIGRPVSLMMIVLIGFALAFGVRIVWGLFYAPLATKLFDLPPNLSSL